VNAAHKGDAPPGKRESVLQRKLMLADLLDPETFGELVKGFAELYKIGIRVFDEKGQKLADVKIGNGDFCGYVFSFAEGRKTCTSTVARVKDGPVAPVQNARLPQMSDGPVGLVAVPCFTGLRYLVLPIRHEGDTLGRVIFGPWAPDDLKDLPETLLGPNPGLDLGVAQTHLAKIRRAPESTVAKVMAHFSQILGALISAGHKTFLTSQLHIEATLEAHHELETQHKKLEEMYGRLKDLDRLKSSFLATVSHELRTPLTSIIGYSEMLNEGMAGTLNPEQKEYVSTIMEKGDTLLRLISSILDISQIEAGKVRLAFEPVDVGALCLSAASSLKPQATKKGLVLEVKLPPIAQRRPSGDREKLKQVIVNLLANAVKFTSKGGKITVTLGEIGPQSELGVEGYRITVSDTGQGIPLDQQDKIFQSFYQVDSSSTREHGGAGLGLAIVKSYVEGHRGQVGVQSTPGQGTTFSVVLPCVPPTAATITPPASEPDRF
jgi:two-component system sensor histidine kinase BarA